MTSLLVHGCFDLVTLKNLESLGVSEFSFDLRSTSTNLIPFSQLKMLLREIHCSRLFLTFENDKNETIKSSLDLLKDSDKSFELILRDARPVEFYHNLNHVFYWMFNPLGEWREILSLPNLRGILLPIKWFKQYDQMEELWQLIEVRHLQVYLHAESFTEAQHLKEFKDLKLSIELSGELETSYRHIDQERLKNLRIWRMINESPLS